MKIEAGYKQTEIGVLPEEWDAVLLDSVAKRGSGHTPTKKRPEYWGGSIKWISLQDSDRLDRLYIDDTAAKITPAGVANSSATMHSAGTVVLSRDAGIGKSAIMTDDMAVSQHFMAWKCGPKLENHFLYYWLQYKKSEFERIAMGSTIKTIGLSYFKQLFLPLPPKKVQYDIAAALTDLDSHINAQEAVIAKKRQIKQSLMDQLLMGKQRIPGFNGEWKKYSLAEIGKFSKGKGIKKDDISADGLPCIRYGEIYMRHQDYIRAFHSFIPKVIAEKSQILKFGDLLFTGSGETSEEIGKCVAFIGSEKAYAGGDIVILSPHEQNSIFLGYLMNHPAICIQKSKMAQGDAVVHISARNIGKLEICIPPLIEQNEIATILSHLDDEIITLETKRDKTRDLKQGMMQELLTGRVQPT